MYEVALTVALLIIAAGTGFLLYTWHQRHRERLRKQVTARRPETPAVVNEETDTRTDFSQPVAKAVAVSRPAQEPSGGILLFQQRLREARASGLALVEAFEKVRELCPEVEDHEAYEACVNAGYTSREFVGILSHRAYTLDEIAEEVNRWYEMDSSEFVAALLPCATGNSAKNRGRAVIQAIKSEWDDFDPTQAVKQLIEFGCSPADVFSLCYDETENEFGKLLMTLREIVPLEVEVAAATSKELDVDLSDEDIYKELRDEDVPYEDIVKMMRLRGETLATILDCEVVYSGNVICDDARDLRDLFAATEIIEAVIDSDDPPPYADIVELATDLGMSYPEIGALFKKKEIKPEDLEDELKDFDFYDRIRLFYAMFPDEPAKEELKKETE